MNKKMFLALTAVAFLAASNAPALPLFTFTGGAGSPLTVSLTQDISFTVPSPVTAVGGMAFLDANAFTTAQAGGFHAATIASGLVLSDSSGPLDVDFYSLGVSPLAPKGLYLFFQARNGNFALPAGDIVTLSAGSTTATSWPGLMEVPAMLASDSLIAGDGVGNVLGIPSAVASVPEPSVLAFAGLGAAALWLCRRPRSKNRPCA